MPKNKNRQAVIMDDFSGLSARYLADLGMMNNVWIVSVGRDITDELSDNSRPAAKPPDNTPKP